MVKGNDQWVDSYSAYVFSKETEFKINNVITINIAMGGLYRCGYQLLCPVASCY